ncbi:MAG TPA: dihydrolipoamide acetyltransferase family protein [Solirubrobacteraceae bacterium]|nr:dihydrolipoamide acetyltransferase family protein [Solirubrobacteraceae bacterium]
MPDVAMPRLSDSMEEGTILKWLKSDGDEIAKGEELVEIETDKATMTYEADADGRLEIVADEGSTLAIGEVIARIGEGGGSSAEASTDGGAEHEASAEGEGEGDGEDSGGGTATKTEAEDEGEEPGEEDGGDEDEGQAEEEQEEEREAQPTASADGDGDGASAGKTAEAPRAPSAEGNGGRPKASPVARRIAREQGIDLSTLEGTGPGGRIVKADVEAAASGGGAAAPEAGRAEAAEEPQAREAPEREEAPAEAPEREEEAAEREPEREKAPAAQTGKGEVTIQEPSRIQQIIARRMAESKATIPHFTLSTDVDMEGAVELREQLKALAEQQDTAVPSFNDMVVKACAIALRDFPLVNGGYRDGKYELYSRVNIGVAVAGEGTLIVPTIFDADHKGLGQIAKESRELAEKVRDGKISPPELSGATFSITNLGMYGVTSFTAVINPPQAAILAVGMMEPKPVVRDGEVVVRHGMNVTIACDHRILSGAPAAEFLARVKAILEQPIALAL